jgi:microcystin degradation protein MlrC
MRIALAGLSTECSTFSPLLATRDQFTVTRGDTLRAKYPFLADHPAHAYLPILRARAMPGGSIDPAAYDGFKAELLDGLRAVMPLDGVFLDMHGAAHVHGMDDAEGDWVEAVRAVVGPSCVISASYDLHGNVSERVFANLDFMTAFRTAPHIDVPQTEARAFARLIQALESGHKLHKALVRVPVALPGERTSTEWQPGTALYAQLETHPAGVADASILVGYVWADEPRAGASVVAYGPDRVAVQAEALRLAGGFWAAREQFTFGVPTGDVDWCIRQAAQAPDMPVLISDSGDNPTAGGAGDVPYALGRLIAVLNEPQHHACQAVYASIPDAAAVDACFNTGEGGSVALSLGGKLDPVNGQPLQGVRGYVAHLAELPWTNDPAQPNRHAVVEVGNVQVILTEKRTPFHFIADFERLGLDVNHHQIVMVKIGYLVPELKRAARSAFLALTPGAVNQDIARLPYRRISRPSYPLDGAFDWTPVLTMSQ